MPSPVAIKVSADFAESVRSAADAAAMGQLWGSSAEARDTLCERLRAASIGSAIS